MIKTDLQVIEMEEVQAAKDLWAEGPELSVAELKEHYINVCKCGVMMVEEPCPKCKGEKREDNKE